MQETIIKLLGLEEYQSIKRIPKREFYEIDDFHKSQEKLLQDHVQNIYLLSALNKDAINISPYISDTENYQEIYYLHIELKNTQKLQELVSLFHNSIAPSCVLILSYSGNIYISGALKRINKNNSQKQVVEEIYTTQVIHTDSLSKSAQKFLEDIHVKQNNFDTFKRFYLDIFGKIFIFLLSELRGEYIKTPQEHIFTLRETYKIYSSLKTKLEQKNLEYKQLVNPGDQAILHQEIRKLESQLKAEKNKLI